MSTPKAITLISVNATQTFNLLVPGATTDSCSLFHNCVTSSCLSPNTISTPSLQIPPPRLTPFHFPFADSRSDQLLFDQIAIQRKKKRMNRRALFSTTILDRRRRGRLSHPPRLQIDDITIPSCLVAPRGGIVFPFRKEFPLPKRLRFRESTRHISLSLSISLLPRVEVFLAEEVKSSKVGLASRHAASSLVSVEFLPAIFTGKTST